MNQFCVNCGAALAAGTRFCIGCGHDNGATAAKPKKDRRWLWWLLAVILAAIIGFLIGRMMAPKCPACPQTANSAGGGGAGGGGGGGHGKHKGGGGVVAAMVTADAAVLVGVVAALLSFQVKP